MRHYHCKMLCEIRRYTALSNSVKCLCNTRYFSVSTLLQKRSPNQSGYKQIWSVTQMFYGVRQCSIFLYFTYLSAVYTTKMLASSWGEAELYYHAVVSKQNLSCILSVGHAHILPF